jgi:hypothetical protein
VLLLLDHNIHVIRLLESKSFANISFCTIN